MEPTAEGGSARRTTAAALAGLLTAGLLGVATGATAAPPEGDRIRDRIESSTYFTQIRHRAMVPFKGHTYFFADDDVHGLELWRSDGTATGTTLFADLTPGDASSDTQFSSIVHNGLGEMAATNGRLYFLTGSFPYTLWYTDGTSAPQKASTDIPYFRSGLIADRDGVWIVGSASLYRLSDGATTVQERPGKSSFYNVGQQGAVLDGVIYYATRDDAAGYELWRSDLTDAGTYRVKDIRAGTQDSNPLGFVASGNRVYFTADDGFHGQELWSTDGTAAGTRLVIDLRTGTADGAIGDWRAAGNTFWFTGVPQGARGATLWRTSGDSPVVVGTFPNTATLLLPGGFGNQVAVSQNSDLRTTAGSGFSPVTTRYNRSPMASIGSDLYFRAWSATTTSRTAIYRSRGGAGRTVAVRTFSDVYPEHLTVAGERILYFVRPSGAPGYRPQFYTPAPAPSRVAIQVKPKRLVLPSRKRVTVRIAVTGLPGSVVVIADGKRKIRTIHLKGRTTKVKLPPKLALGKHKITATLRPTDLTTGARDKAVLRVVRAKRR